MRQLIRAWLVVGALACVDCSKNAGSQPEPTQALRVDAELAGCAAVRDGPVCELAKDPKDRVLRVWTAVSSGARVSFESDVGAVAASEPKPVQGGALYRLTVPEKASSVSMRVREGATEGAWSIRVETAAPDQLLDEVATLRDRGDLEGASSKLRGAVGTRTGESRARALSMLARVELARGRLDDALPFLRQAVDAHRAAGWRSGESDDALRAAYALIQRRRFVEARAMIAEARGSSEHWSEGRVRLPYWEGYTAFDAGDLRAALASFKEAERLATRFEMPRVRREAQQFIARALQRSGRVEESLAMLAALTREAPEMSACDRADLLTNVGWVSLLARERAGATPPSIASGPQATSGDPAQRPGGETLRGKRARRARPLLPLVKRGAPPVPPRPRVTEPDPIAPLREALTTIRTRCPGAHDEANVLVNLALGALQNGDGEAAALRLEEARQADAAPTSETTIWWLELEGRVALARGKPEAALSFLDNEARFAAASISPDGVWRASSSRGEALEAIGRYDAAIASYQAAEDALDDSILSVPLDEGRDTFASDREKSARYLVDLLVRSGRDAEALAAARRARARAIAGLERADRLAHLSTADRARWEEAIGEYRRQRDAIEGDAARDWKLPRDRLAAVLAERKTLETRLRGALDAAYSVLAGPGGAGVTAAPRRPVFADPPAGELLVAYHPVRNGWVALTSASDGVTAFPLGEIDATAAPVRLADQLLAPLRARIVTAKRLRLLTYGMLRDVDFHALPWGPADAAGAIAADPPPLVEALTVEYPLDLPGLPGGRGRGAQARAGDPNTGAVVVSDPSGDLPAARREGESVSSALSGTHKWSIVALQGGQATPRSLSDALVRADLFHYAGHGIFAGRGGWESSMPLSGGALTVSDILALPHVPRRVVLSGCETARSAREGAAEGVGLANAFVAAGADSVVAAVRPVQDSLAEEMMVVIYRTLAQDGGDVASALRAAQLAVRSKHPAGDWAGFRVLVP